MNQTQIEIILEQLKKRMTSLQDRKFFGSLKIEIEYKSGGVCSAHVGDREKIL